MGRPTDVGNGVPLCWHDHHLVHELRWSVGRDADSGIVDWYRPDGGHAGSTHPRVRPKPLPVRTREPAVAGAP